MRINPQIQSLRIANFKSTESHLPRFVAGSHLQRHRLLSCRPDASEASIQYLPSKSIFLRSDGSCVLFRMFCEV